MMITRLTNRYKRRAMSAPNFTFYAWKFVANALPTYHALRMGDGQRHRDTIATLREQGIVMAGTDQFLSEVGRAALAEASAAITKTSNSDRVRQIVAGGGQAKSGKKDFLLNLVKYD